jgi:multidrug efflux pump subunit AcrA (membrane-fusion protein)
MRSSLLSLTTILLFAVSAGAQQMPSIAGTEIRAENCFVQYINKSNVAAKALGTLMELRFEEGATVNAGDVMAIIDDTAAKLELDLKKAEEKEAVLNAANEVNLKDAVNSEELASSEAKAYDTMYRERAIPYWEKEKKRLEAERARLRIDLADMQKKIAEAQMIAKFSEVKIAEYELTRRQVTAPSTGFIEERIAQLGEWVQPGTPIATLIQMDKLRVEGDVDALRYPGQIVQGMPVQVLVYAQGHDNAEKAISFDAKLGFVSMEIDINNRYRVWVELDNDRTANGDWRLKPGMRAEIIIQKSAELF